MLDSRPLRDPLAAGMRDRRRGWLGRFDAPPLSSTFDRMSVADQIPSQRQEPSVPPTPPSNGRRRRRIKRGGEPPRRTRLRKLRLLAIVLGFAILAFISTVFGMMMAVASDIPEIENQQQYSVKHNSFLYDDHGNPIGIFAPPNNVVIDRENEISWAMRRAIVAVEDRRFWSDPGVDIRGIARAFVADVFGGEHQGGSTIAQQFVKNALSEQNNRTVFEKLREAALAYHLTRRWKPAHILNEYLNSIYFGNGAYGVESAARVYFGRDLGFVPQETDNASATTTQTSPRCGDGALPKCASLLTPPQAALLAGMVANPSAFDPILHPAEAKGRRNLVLKDMLQQHYLTRAQYAQYTHAPLPTTTDIQQPTEPTAAPYFTSWLRPQILAAMGLGRGVPANIAEYRAYYGGLKIRTTLDLKLQRAAEEAISSELPSGEQLPTASLAAIDTKTGEVRAMVGGPIIDGEEDYAHHPFNLATEGLRQPGSAFKPFTLAMALESGEYSPDSIIDSAPQDFIVPNSGGKEHFIVHNFGNTYSGPISLAAATAISDNSVYSQVGIHVGTKRIARLARRMGIRTPVSHNYAMILGGLKVGVSPLDMAHAYETFATGGLRVYNPQLGAPDQGPTGIAEIKCPICRHTDLVDHPMYRRVLPASIAKTVHDILTGVVQRGTGTEAAISGVDVAGKTGTTSNYGDAWFVGWTPQLTVAVWVGFPDKLVSMATDYNGGPVEGGTYPAIIWRNFMEQALQILASEQPQSSQSNITSTTDTTGLSSPSVSSGSVTSTQTSATSGSGTTGVSTSTNPGATSGTGVGTGGGSTGNGGGSGAGGGAGGTGSGTGSGSGGGGGGTGSGSGGGGGSGSGGGGGSGGSGGGGTGGAGIGGGGRG